LSGVDLNGVASGSLQEDFMIPLTRLQATASAVAKATALALLAASAQARTYVAAEMNTDQLRALDTAKTVVLMPGGILEEHGPYLPSYTDGYVSERMAADVADALVERGWDVLVFPQLPLGSGGANELGGKYPFPGTYAIRLDTLRSLYLDLADELGESGFKWVFVINSHGAPNHGRVLDQVGEYFSETYHAHMQRISGFGPPAAGDPRSTLSEQAKKEDAYSGHAGIDETSLMLFLEPELVSLDYKHAPAFPASGDGGMIGVAKRKDWTGYFGAPRYASAEYGAKLYSLHLSNMIKQALGALDPAARQAAAPRSSRRTVDDAAIARDRAIEQRQKAWLKKNEQP
jgi:creatinine amidohydrolase